LPSVEIQGTFLRRSENRSIEGGRKRGIIRAKPSFLVVIGISISGSPSAGFAFVRGL